MTDSSGARRPIRVGLVTNIPAPYRVPVFNLLASRPEIDLHVFYAAQREPDRNWDLPTLTHPHTFLKERFVTVFSNYIHFNPDIWSSLRRVDPDIVVTTGYSPTHLLSFLFAKWYGRRHVAMTDGTVESEGQQITAVHRLLRRVVLRRSDAYLAASRSGRALLRSYGAQDTKIFASPLCANTSVDWQTRGVKPPLDLLFSGRLVEIKNPLFALRVAHGASLRLGRKVSLGMLGSGPLEASIRELAAQVTKHVELHLAGAVSQAEVPEWFLRSSVFLFPTSWDPWGVVANEACLAGVPSIVSPHAGAAGELLVDGVNALVRPLDLQTWIDAAVLLLDDPAMRARLSARARVLVAPFNFANAAQGIIDAARAALGEDSMRSKRARRRPFAT